MCWLTKHMRDVIHGGCWTASTLWLYNLGRKLPGRLHCNADGVSRPICKQCWGKNFTTPWIDEFERADELTAPLGIHALFVPTEVSTEELRELQREDPVISPLLDFLDRVPNVLQNKLFDTVHSGPIAAHLGAERMLQQLRQYYYWSGMRRDIYTWTLQCTQCQKSKPAPSRAHGHLKKSNNRCPSRYCCSRHTFRLAYIK